MRCRHCGKEIPESSERCPGCGVPILRIRPSHRCAGCGAEVPEGEENCPGCGKRVRRKAEPGREEACREKNEYVRDASQKSEEKMLPAELKRFFRPEDRLAWAAAVLPAASAILYHFTMLPDFPFFNLLNTALLYLGMNFLMGSLLASELDKWSLRRSGRGIGGPLRLLLCFFPMEGLRRRRMLPGMDPRASYPWVQGLLFLLLLFSLF